MAVRARCKTPVRHAAHEKQSPIDTQELSRNYRVRNHTSLPLESQHVCGAPCTLRYEDVTPCGVTSLTSGLLFCR